MGDYLRLSAWATMVLAWLLFGCGFFGMTGDGVLVGSDEAAVVTDDLSGEMEVYLPGSRFNYNDTTQTVTFYNLTLQQFTLCRSLDDTDATETSAITARTLDRQPIWFDVTVVYRIDPQQVGSVHSRWGDRYLSDFTIPTVREIMPEVAAIYPADQFYGADRAVIEQAMQDRVSEAFAAEGFILHDFLLRDFWFTEEYTRQIEVTAIFLLTEAARTPTPSPTAP